MKLVTATMMPTRTTLLTDIVGVNDMANAFGYQMFFFGLTIFFGNPLAGTSSLKKRRSIR